MNSDLIAGIEYQLAVLLRRAEYVRYSGGTDARGPLDRSGYLILRRLAEGPAMAIREIASTFQVDISTASRQVAALEEKSLVIRTSHPEDKRVSLIDITDDGRQRLLDMQTVRYTLYQRLVGDWPEADQRIFIELLHRLNSAIESGRSANASEGEH